MADFAEKQMIDIDFMIDTLEGEVQILEGKLGIEPVKPNEWLIDKKLSYNK